jgi:MYXO-CTERM domain-containing protein
MTRRRLVTLGSLLSTTLLAACANDAPTGGGAGADGGASPSTTNTPYAETPHANLGVAPGAYYAGPADTSRLVEQRAPIVTISNVEESRPLRELRAAKDTDAPEEVEHEVRRLPRRPWHDRAVVADPVVQSEKPISTMPAAITNFGGQGRSTTPGTVTGTPPDTNGTVGPNHYVQVVNGGIAIWNKTGTVAQAAKLLNVLWAGYTGTNAGNGCAANNDGDPVVVYDQLADRWFLTQFSLPNSNSGPNFQCVAVSKTPDPTGAYYLYDFTYPGLNDYGKFGIWPDGYYATYNMFNGSFQGDGDLCVFDRVSMLAGKPATQQCFQQTGGQYFGLLPISLDGSIPPPRGEPGLFAAIGTAADTIDLWKLQVDWKTPANTKLTGPTSIPVAAFTAACSGGGDCIPSSGGKQLASLADRLMFRLSYRNFGTHEALFVNHAVTSGAATGVRWYEIRSPAGPAPTVFQQGTYAPADGKSRWMASLAQDQAQDIAVGFSISSSTTNPSIAWTGQLPTDPVGTLPQGETVILAGTATESAAASRWGDYSNMTVDPSDDCTFWYTTELYKTSGTSTWDTQIASVKFPRCAANDFTITLAPPTQDVQQQRTATFTVTTATKAGTAEAIALNIQDLPTGVTAAFAPATVNAGTPSTLTLTATGTTPLAAAAAITVIGKAPSAVHAATAQVGVVACQPDKVCKNGQNCDTAPDGCGGTLTCGTCTAPQTCGGRGTPGQCGCNNPTTCAAQGAQCGSLDDKCGGTLDCGTCAGGGTCTANKCVGGSSSGTSGASGSSGDGGDTNGANGDTPANTSGCGCRTVAPRSGSPWAAFGALALAGLLVTRRRRR